MKAFLRRLLPIVFILFVTFLIQPVLFVVPAGATQLDIIIDEDEEPVATPLPNTYAYTGAATHKIPIQVPPGRLGMEPSLALSYNSYHGNGWLGVGWEIKLGAIQRSTKRGVDFSGTDFVVNGNGSTSELAPRTTWGTNYYGAKIEGAFTKYSFDGATSGWVATTRDGIQYYYGRSAGSRQDNPGNNSQVYKWCLDRIEDTNGNYLTISYTKDQGQIYPDTIEYSGNVGESASPTNRVEFILTTRTDVPLSYQTKFAVRTAKRLSAVELYTNSQLARKYTLAYEYGTSSSNSRLTSLQVVGSNGSSTLPATTFEYAEGGTGAYTSKGNTIQWTNDFKTGDINADGRQDIVLVRSDSQDGGGGDWTTYYWDAKPLISTGSGNFTAGTGFEIGSSDLDRFAWNLGDVDGDGDADLITTQGTRLSDGSGGFGSSIGGGSSYKILQVGDFNGDGLVDRLGLRYTGVISCSVSCYYISVDKSNGDGTFTRTADINTGIYPDCGVPPEERDCPGYSGSLHISDVNGDGFADIISSINGYGVYLSNGNGTFGSKIGFSLSQSDSFSMGHCCPVNL